MIFASFLYDTMADFELTLPSTALGMWTGNDIITFSLDGQAVKGMSGQSYLPDYSLKDLVNHEIDGIIIPGGMSILEDDLLNELLCKLHRKRKLIAAICAGPEYLANAGLLADIKYTTSKEAEHFETDPFPRNNYLEKRVVVDGNVITAKGTAFVEFAVELMDYIGAFENKSDKIAMIKEFSTS